jgi:hypothetical protein
VIPWTTKLNDPRWQAPPGAKFGFLIQTPRTLEFDVVLIENDYTLDSVLYVHHVKLEKKAGWQEVVLSPEDFKTEKNRKGKKSQVLGNWRPFDSLEFGSKGGDRTDGVTFANIRWVVQ